MDNIPNPWFSFRNKLAIWFSLEQIPRKQIESREIALKLGLKISIYLIHVCTYYRILQQRCLTWFLFRPIGSSYQSHSLEMFVDVVYYNDLPANSRKFMQIWQQRKSDKTFLKLIVGIRFHHISVAYFNIFAICSQTQYVKMTYLGPAYAIGIRKKFSAKSLF